MKKDDTRLYNVLFPIWMLLMLPRVWLFVIPANFVIDSVVVLITLSVLARRRSEIGYRPWKDWSHVIWLVWLFGFISDIFGSGFMLFWGCVPWLIDREGAFGLWWSDHVGDPIVNNPFTSPFATLFTVAAIALAGLLIYVFNKKVSFKKLAVTDREKKTLALTLAIATAPWVMLLPSEWFWR